MFAYLSDEGTEFHNYVGNVPPGDEHWGMSRKGETFSSETLPDVEVEFVPDEASAEHVEEPGQEISRSA